MRAWWLLLVLPTAAGLTLEDPQGDVEQAWLGADVELLAQDAMDLVRFKLVEDPEQFTFHVEAVAPGQTGGPATGWRTVVSMLHGAQAYEHRLSFFYPVGATSPQPFPWVEVFQQSDAQWILMAAPELRADEGRYTWSMLRDLLVDERGAPPEIGRSFGGVRVASEAEARMDAGAPSLWRFVDALPDEGNASHPIQYGLAQAGARLSSYEPFRVSNGEAGRFYFRAALAADVPGAFDLRVEDIPAGWTVRLATDHVEVDEPVEVVVEATVPFAHQHGSRQDFRLVAESTEALAQLAMGIHYVDIPQPSGHHPRVWLHSDDGGIESSLPVTRSGTRASAYVNAAQEDLGDSGEPIQPSRSGLLNVGDGGSRMVLHYDLGLLPQLRMGLNVTDQTTEFQVTIDAVTPLPQATLRGALQYWRPDAWTDIATIDAPIEDLGPGVHTLDGTLSGIPQVVAYERPMRLRIDLELHADVPDVHLSHVTPYLLPAGWFDLPLAEYEESIADSSGFVQSEAAPDADGFDATPAPTADTPGPGLVAVLAVLALSRRAARR